MSKTKKLTLTTRGRHALMAMLELARQEGDTPVPLSQISKSGQISLSYLEQLFACLRRNRLVKSYRGPGGGYVLAQPAGEIPVSAILMAVENCLPAGARNGDDKSPRAGGKLWSHIGELLYMYLQQVTLEDVANNNMPPPAQLLAQGS